MVGKRLSKVLVGLLLAGLLAALAGAQPAEARPASGDSWTWWLHAPWARTDSLAAEQNEMQRMREEMMSRRRRFIYNNDGGPWSGEQLGTPEGFLYGPHSRMGAVVGTGVDSVFLGGGATHVLTHASDVTDSYADTEDLYGPFAGHTWDLFRDDLRALEALGTDRTQLTVEFCQEHDLEVFYSYRVNDLHLALVGCCDIERSTWWRENPECRLGAAVGIGEEATGLYPSTDRRKWGWAGLNFELPQVRRFLYSVIEDVVNRYDLDGLEIDYLRAPLFFASNLEGKPATAEQLDILTDFQRQVRRIAEEAGQRRGRPMLVAARIPFTIPGCEYVGIDVHRWLEEGLVDMVGLSGGYVPFSAPSGMGPMIRLGQRHGVPVHAVISGSGFRGSYGSIEGWRGAASNVWRAGADGLYVFNHFPNQPSPQFLELGDPQKLATLDKLFVVENDPASYRGHFYAVLDSSAAVDDPHSYGANLDVHPPSRVLPTALDPAGSWTLALLAVGDDLPRAGSLDLLDSAVLRVQISDPAVLGEVEVRLNGKGLTPTETDAEAGRLSFLPAPSSYRVGDNAVEVRFTRPRGAGAEPVQITAVEAHVKYRR